MGKSGESVLQGSLWTAVKPRRLSQSLQNSRIQHCRLSAGGCLCLCALEVQSLSCLHQHAADVQAGALAAVLSRSTEGTSVKAGLFFSGAHPGEPRQICFLCSGCLVSIGGNRRQIRLKPQGCCSWYCCHRSWQN